jgi:hypothetical protein
MSNIQPNQVEGTSPTPIGGEPNLAYARNTCAVMEPNFPAAAEMPWHVPRNLVGNTSAAIYNIAVRY